MGCAEPGGRVRVRVFATPGLMTSEAGFQEDLAGPPPGILHRKPVARLGVHGGFPLEPTLGV